MSLDLDFTQFTSATAHNQNLGSARKTGTLFGITRKTGTGSKFNVSSVSKMALLHTSTQYIDVSLLIVFELNSLFSTTTL